MPLYRKKLTYDEIEPYIQPFVNYLRTQCKVQPKAGSPEQEVYLIGKEELKDYSREYHKMISPLLMTKMLYHVPYDGNHTLLYFDPQQTGPEPTVSLRHVRLPKLSHLITLTPEDFFALMRLIDTAKPATFIDTFSLNPAAADIPSFKKSVLSRFFIKLPAAYRMEPDLSDKKWTPRGAISLIANKEPTVNNQLSVMQYFTTMQNSDIFYFPIETAIDLDIGLDWVQMSDDYCVPTDA